MWRYTLQRIAGVLSQLLLISLCAFVIMKAAPGDPVASLVGGREFMTEDDHKRVSHNLGLDQPLVAQYGIWLGRLLNGDWGRSIRDGRDVGGVVWHGLKATLVLTGISAIAIAVIAIVGGYWAGIRAHTRLDYAISGFALISFATPAFWLGLVLILLFSVTLDLLPSSGQSSLGRDENLVDYLQHLFLPVTCIVLTHAGPYIRLVRGSIRDVLATEYYRAARARGLPERILVWRYLLPNALTPFATWMGLTLPLLVGGTFIVEWVFGWPGIGRLFLQAAIARDYPMLMASVLTTGVLVIAGNLLADMLIARLNPRFRRTSAGE
ncbi:peptide/nickel transport system permease protein [Nitrosospira sp. Nl5]|uniref:ABC transporter permease n=1 Tax=Nitrosospira sp. Nl5 TaxID=200120 RepID=UPI000887A985|nr:ABC transporter permease [Nitrosospira sp. Nl5]SCY03608.1 peptide/nickel transport system permease protein [Nitrosospira sp. Nl5]